MEENVPLESSSRKKFEKTVKGIKKLLKEEKKKKETTETPEIINEKTEKSKRSLKNPVSKNRGVVYIGHIPHGFYEDQMKAYFKQFGKVTNVRVARSAKTGVSKGYAFVEFQSKEVAEIVAETMNNYLMDKRLLKAEFIPPERQRPKYFDGPTWVPGKKCPGLKKRKKAIKIHNQSISEKEWIQSAKNQLKRLNKTKSKLRSLGIDYDFFQPCDIPEQLTNPTSNNKNKNIDKSTDADPEDSPPPKKKNKKANKTPVSPPVDAKVKKTKKVDDESAKTKKVKSPLVVKPPKVKRVDAPLVTKSQKTKKEIPKQQTDLEDSPPLSKKDKKAAERMPISPSPVVADVKKTRSVTKADKESKKSKQAKSPVAVKPPKVGRVDTPMVPKSQKLKKEKPTKQINAFKRPLLMQGLEETVVSKSKSSDKSEKRAKASKNK